MLEVYFMLKFYTSENYCAELTRRPCLSTAA